MGHSSESGETSASEAVDAEVPKSESITVFPLVSSYVVDFDEDSNNDDAGDGTSVISKKVHRCCYEGCNKQFSRPWRLAAHLRTHTGELPFKCTFEACSKAYTTASHLKRHKINAHEQRNLETSFRCPFPGCDVEMKYQWNVKKHYKAKHQSKIFKCTLCTESFKKHSQLRAHMYWHTGVPPLQCTKCNAGFLKECHLNSHMRHHKEYACEVTACSQVFYTWTQLRKHMALEHPKEYICDHCKKVFHNKSRLRCHVIAHTDKSEREVIFCPHSNCGRFYFEKKNLDHHIRVSHEKRTFPCTHPGCDRELSCQLQILSPATWPCETAGSREITEVEMHGVLFT